ALVMWSCGRQCGTQYPGHHPQLHISKSFTLVEKKRHEHLVRTAAQRELQEVAHRTWRGQVVALADVLDDGATHELDHRFELHVFRRPQPADIRDLIERGREQPLQAAEARDDVAPELDCAPARDTGAQEDREELRFGQRRSAVLEQPFARTFVFEPLGDSHDDAPYTLMPGHI